MLSGRPRRTLACVILSPILLRERFVLIEVPPMTLNRIRRIRRPDKGRSIGTEPKRTREKSQLEESVEDAELLLNFAAQQGIRVEREVVEVIAGARELFEHTWRVPGYSRRCAKSDEREGSIVRLGTFGYATSGTEPD